jgi:hypothetical protein
MNDKEITRFNPAQLARLNTARRLPLPATVSIVLGEYAALIPSLQAAASVPALQAKIAHLESALAAEVAATQREAKAAEDAKAHAAEVRKALQAGKAVAESRALRAEAALASAQAAPDTAELETMRKRLAVAESKVADQAAQIHSLLTIRRQRNKGVECETAGCTDLQYARGLCIRHYQQERRAQASGICPQCKKVRPVGRSGRCRSCYLTIVTERGREAARCAHVDS